VTSKSVTAPGLWVVPQPLAREGSTTRHAVRRCRRRV